MLEELCEVRGLLLLAAKSDGDEDLLRAALQKLDNLIDGLESEE